MIQLLPIAAALEFGTELLKTFNAAQANKPPEQVRVEALVMWNIAKVVLRPLLTEQQLKDLKAQGVEI